MRPCPHTRCTCPFHTFCSYSLPLLTCHLLPPPLALLVQATTKMWSYRQVRGAVQGVLCSDCQAATKSASGLRCITLPVAFILALLPQPLPLSPLRPLGHADDRPCLWKPLRVPLGQIQEPVRPSIIQQSLDRRGRGGVNGHVPVFIAKCTASLGKGRIFNIAKLAKCAMLFLVFAIGQLEGYL